MGATTGYLFARADWTYSVGQEIPYADSTPFDVSGLIFGTNAFNSAAALTGKVSSDQSTSATALFATYSNSYGDLLCAIYNKSLTLSTTEYDGAIAHFGRFYTGWSNVSVVFNGATVDFSSSETNKPVFEVLNINPSITIENNSSITVNSNGYETPFSVNGTFILSNSSFKVIGEKSGAVSSAKMEIKDGATFEAGSFEDDSGHPVTISGNGTKFTVTGKYDNGGALIVEDGAEFTAGSFVDGGSEYTTVRGNGTKFTVVGLFDNGGTLTVEDGAEFRTGSFTAEGTEHTTVKGSGTKFTVDGMFDNGGILAVKDGAVFKAQTVENEPSEHIEISGGTFRAETVDNLSSISITSDPVNGTPSDVSVGRIVFAEGPSPKLEMDWKSTMNFTEITGALDHVRIIIDLEGIELSSEQKILDFQGTGTAPTEAYYKQLLGEDAWNAAASSPFLAGFAVVDGDLIIKKTYGTVYMQENGNDSTATPEAPYFATVAGAAAVTPAQIIVRDYSEDSDHLTVADASYFNGFKAQIGESTSGETITFEKNLYAGSRYTGSGDKNAVIVNPLTINCGTMKFVSGGSLVSMDSNSNTVTFKGSTELIINGGTFSYIMVGAGKVTKGNFIQNGNINVTINGGQFDAGVCCGAIYSSAAGIGDGTSTINGDLLLTIKGGSFKSGTWIYGGSASGKKEQSYSCVNTINGNTCITIDASGNSIQLGNVVAGSHGYGVINGNTQLVFKGSDANLTISGQLWGGCSGDTYAIDETDPAFRSVLQTTAVTGKRILSFDGFNGALKCTKIRCFNTFEARNESAVTLAKTAYDLSEIENWSFEYGSSLTDSDFVNDFNGDTLNLTGLSSGWTGDWAILKNTNSAGFANFNGLKVYMGDSYVGAVTGNQLAWSANNVNYTLALSDGKMSLTGIIA